MTEIMENLVNYTTVQGWNECTDATGWGKLKNFDRDILNKTVRPFKKWAYVEGVACFLKIVELMSWMRKWPVSQHEVQLAKLVLQRMKMGTGLGK